MLEQLKYKNHMNEVVEFGKNGIFVNSNDLRDYAWNVTTKGNRISSFDYSVSTKKLPVKIICETEEAGTAIKNRLFEVGEKDILAMQHGTIILGDYYLRCFVTGCEKADYLTGKQIMNATLTLTTDYPYWTKETKFSFFPLSVGNDDGTFLDYDMDFPIDYFSDVASKPVNNSGFVASNFKIIIYGHCVNPLVNISGHIYQVFCTVDENQYLTIDSSVKRIYLTERDGTQINVFSMRNKASYIFEKVPCGQNVISWNGDFGFDIILLEERSEPKWT